MPDEWPRWWRGVERVELLRSGGANQVGSIRRYTFKSRLRYRLVFHLESTRVDPMTVIEGRATGELEGFGRWQLSEEGAATHVRYDWQVATTKAWMRILAPIARPVFGWITTSSWSGAARGSCVV
jgi:hypothetical protein